MLWMRENVRICHRVAFISVPMSIDFCTSVPLACRYLLNFKRNVHGPIDAFDMQRKHPCNYSKRSRSYLLYRISRGLHDLNDRRSRTAYNRTFTSVCICHCSSRLW